MKKIIYRYHLHYAKVRNYDNDEYKWRPVIPIKQVGNAWVVIPLFSAKTHQKFFNEGIYFQLQQKGLQNSYIDLSRFDKIWIDNFNNNPIIKNYQFLRISKQQMKTIQTKMNRFLYGEISLTKELEFLDQKIKQLKVHHENNSDYEKELEI